MKNGHSKKLEEFELKVFHRGDFRKNEATLAAEVEEKLGRPLREGECALVVSGTEKVIRFIFGVIEKDHLVDARGRPMSEATKVLPSRTYRITHGGRWHPLMMQNYANEMGLTLKNMERLERHLKAEVREAAEN